MAQDTAVRNPRPATAPTARAQAEEAGRDLILVLARIGLGILMIWHTKVMWDFTGGVAGSVAGFDQSGVPLPELTARFNLALEFFGGIALILGAGVRVIGVLMAFTMAGAWYFVHDTALYSMSGSGPETVIAIGLVSLLLVVTGGGRLALDPYLSRLPHARRFAHQSN